MLKRLVSLVFVFVFGLGVLTLSGCENDAQNTALIGTALGAGIGALAGGDTEGALVGAAVGGGAGYVVGNESDKKKERAKTQAEIDAVRAEQNVITVWITNSNGSQIPVKLVKDGPGFIGPRGEHYQTMPTEEQLKTVYGF